MLSIYTLKEFFENLLTRSNERNVNGYFVDIIKHFIIWKKKKFLPKMTYNLESIFHLSNPEQLAKELSVASQSMSCIYGA
jgi:hypothetical protein